MEYTRFDVPEAFKVLLDKAIEIDIVDGSDIVVLMVNYHMRWERMVDEIVMYAYCNRHHSQQHNIIVPYADNFYASLKKDVDNT